MITQEQAERAPETLAYENAIAIVKDIQTDDLLTPLDRAIILLKQCVNYDGEGMTTAISGELGDKIRKFIGRCGE